jgi:hypothetical protein
MTKLISILLLTGCTKIIIVTGPLRKIKLYSGEVTECRFIKWSSCGFTLKECVDGKQYECQTNIQILSGGESK